MTYEDAKIGNRIRVIGALPEEPAGAEDLTGKTGTIIEVRTAAGETQYEILWDDNPKRTLFLLAGDPFEIID